MPAYNIIRHPSPGIFNPIGHTETQQEADARKFRQLQSDYFSGKMKWEDYKKQADALSGSPVVYQAPTNYGGGTAQAAGYTPQYSADKYAAAGILPGSEQWADQYLFNPNFTPAPPPDTSGQPVREQTIVDFVPGTPLDVQKRETERLNSGGGTTPTIPNPYLPPSGNPTTPAGTAAPPAVNIDNAPINPTANLTGISPQGQYNPAGGTFVNPSGGTRPQRKRSATNYFNRNWFGGKV